MKVEVLKIPIRHNGSLYTKGESFSISDGDFDRIKDHVKVVQERKKGGDANDGKGS